MIGDPKPTWCEAMTAALTKAQAEYYGTQQPGALPKSVMSPPPELTKQQRSLLRLSMTAAQLHARCLAGGIEPPRTPEGASQPLQLMKTCLATLEKGLPK
jgi:hypothetical protein